MGRVTKGVKKCLDVMNMFIILHMVSVSLMCAHMSKLTKLYTLSMCSLLYVNYSKTVTNIQKALSLREDVSMQLGLM